MGGISIVRYENEYKDRWNHFVKKAKNGLFMYDRDYMDYHSDRFTDHSLLFFHDDQLIALLPANERNNMLVSHGGLTYGGLLVDTSAKQHTVNDCFEALMQYARANGIGRVIYKPVPHMFHQQPAEEDIYALSRMGGMLTEVSSSTVVYLKDPLKMPKGRKAQISRARREGVEVKILEDKKDYETFIDLENTVLEAYHGVKAVHTADELYLLHSRFPQNICLFGAIKDGEMIAGTVVFEYAQAVHTQYMASGERGRMIGALDLAVATVMDRYKETKRWLDFGVSTEEHGSILNEGLIAQKEGFGGRTNVYTVWEINVEG